MTIAQGSISPVGIPDADAISRHNRTMLWLLLIVYIFNFLDRQIVNILAEPIKADLSLSDTQLGLLAGPAFAVFYAVLGIPIARYADRPNSNRVRLISLSLAIWSGMTAVCGLALNFWQLALARIGVGVGEAGCTPAAHSLISDSVRPEKRSSAIAFYGMGVPIGSLLGLIIGGVVNDLYGWRVALMMVGLPGLLLAVALLVFMKEPRLRRTTEEVATQSAKIPLSVREAAREIFTSRAYIYLLVATSVTAFLGYGKSLWTISFFVRSHGLSTTQVGLAMAVVLGVAGALGTWLGGRVADHYGARDKRHILTMPAIGMAIAAPMLFLGYYMEDWRVAVALLILPTVLNSAYYGPSFACVQGLVRPEARAVAASIMLFCQNLIGLGMGPFLFGVLSDSLMPAYGQESVRYVLYGAAFLGLIPALFFWRASLRLSAEMKTG
jgi:predicted MFS family arabinose efflux permease